MNCDKSYCDNNPGFDVQCARPGRNSEGQNTMTCDKFENSKTLKCAKNYYRCATVLPSDRAMEIYMWVSDDKDRHPQGLAVSGYNMNTQCLRLIMVRNKQSCKPEDINEAVTTSGEIMDSGGYPVLDQDDRSVHFSRIVVFKEGRFKLCLVQVYLSEDDTKPRIVNSITLGHVTATRKPAGVSSHEPPKQLETPKEKKRQKD
eukprot:Selendium_serpulae@DN10300_c0_g1_i1.p1